MQDISDRSRRPASKRIAICADDFGMNAGIDAGILQLAQAGRLSAVSCLSQAPSWPANAGRLRELPVDAGLHLNFSAAFDENGLYLPLGRLVRACYLRQLPMSRIIDSIERQFDAFATAFGRMPDFVDGHQHVHQLPLIRDALLPIIARRYSDKRPWLRNTRRPAALRRQRFKAAVIAALGAARFVAMAERQGLPSNRHLLGVYGFSGGAEAYAILLRHWLAIAEEGDLLMCHPAIGSAPDDAIARQRPIEFAVFSDPRLPDWLARSGCRLAALSGIFANFKTDD